MTMNLYLVERIMSSPDNAVRVELRVQCLRSAPDVLTRNCMHLLKAIQVLREMEDLNA
jgi:hypothetical protein